MVDKLSYKLVADLYFVYEAMEEEMHRLKDHPVLAPIAFEQLDRRQAIEKISPTSVPIGATKWKPPGGQGIRRPHSRSGSELS